LEVTLLKYCITLIIQESSLPDLLARRFFGGIGQSRESNWIRSLPRTWYGGQVRSGSPRGVAPTGEWQHRRSYSRDSIL